MNLSDRDEVIAMQMSTQGSDLLIVCLLYTSELFGIIHFVFFSPEDLNIIKDGPSGRRRFIDLELSQLDKVYLRCV